MQPIKSGGDTKANGPDMLTLGVKSAYIHTEVTPSQHRQRRTDVSNDNNCISYFVMITKRMVVCGGSGCYGSMEGDCDDDDVNDDGE